MIRVPRHPAVSGEYTVPGSSCQTKKRQHVAFSGTPPVFYSLSPGQLTKKLALFHFTIDLPALYIVT